MISKYEKDAYQFLAFYRFLAYALAVMFTQIGASLSTPMMSPVQLYITLSILGIYTILKVFSPLRWQKQSKMTYIILAGDFILCIMLLVYTNGLNSIFLLYSLTPIMTAALLFEEKVAITLAAIATISLSVTHLTLSQFSERFIPILEGNNLALLIVYTLFSFVSATVPFRTNLNLRRRIESESIFEERRRLAREIHDGVAQSLGYLNLKTKLVNEAISSQNTAQALTDLSDIQETVKNTYEDIRESIDQLSTETGSLPIVSALANHIREFSKKYSIEVQFDVAKAFPKLSPVADLQLLRITQEALTNVRRHATANKVEVKLEYTNETETMLLTVKDNGQGFSLSDQELSTPSYHGLKIIKERAEGLGGRLDISSTPGKGTTIAIILPIEKVRL